MALAKVWNDNVHPFSQKFNGELITIPPKGYVEMDFYDAHSFKSKGSPMAKDGMGQQDPKSFKMLRVEGKLSPEDKVIAYKSHVDGSLHASKEALEDYEKQFDHMKVATTEERVVNKGGRPKKEA